MKIIDKLFQKIPENNRVERIWILARTDFVLRYYGSSLGLLWAFLNPMFRILVYYFVFSYLVFKNRDSSFILYLFIGVITWMFFSQGTKKGMKALNSKRYLIENIQLNKLDIFYSSVITVSIGFCFNLFIYLLFSQFYHVQYNWHLLFAPLLIFNMMLLIFGASLILSTLFIFFKDLDHIWDIVLLVGFWTVPIIWDQKFIFEYYSFMLYVTPITGVLINFREIFIYGNPLHWDLFFYDYAYTIFVILVGYLFFKKFSPLAAQSK